MIIFPAIDLIGGKAVRLLRGDYDRMTVYDDDPVNTARTFVKSGADHIHVVDLDGAKNGSVPNFDVVVSIKKHTGAFCEIGGGIRSTDVIEKYLSAGVDRVIIGTSAVTDPDFLQRAVDRFHEKIAVGVDLKDGLVAIKGWTQTSDLTCEDFFTVMENTGVSTLICTDVSRDGAMEGTNLSLYKDLSEKHSVNIVASGGVSSLEDVKELKKLDLYGAIIGKAYYTGAIDLAAAIEEAK